MLTWLVGYCLPELEINHPMISFLASVLSAEEPATIPMDLSSLSLSIFSFCPLSYHVMGVSLLVCLVFSVQCSKCLLKPGRCPLPHIEGSDMVIF